MEQERTPPRAEAFALFMSALLAGGITFLFLFFEFKPKSDPPIHPVQDGFWPAFVMGAIVLIAWPFIGWVVIAIACALRRWAYAGEVEEWTKGERILLAAAWPLSLLWSFVVYPAMGFIYRFF